MKKILITILVLFTATLCIFGCSSKNEPKSLAEASISILGDSISTWNGISNNAEMNETIGNNNVYYHEGHMLQEETYWGLLLKEYGMELCVNNSTGGGKVSDDVGSDGVRLSGVKRCMELKNVTGQSPDIIAVYMGTNDFLTAVPASIFEETYIQMLDSMLEEYKDAELFCFTLIPTKDRLYENQLKVYNDVIVKVVSQYEERVTLVDVYGKSGITWENISDYTIDGIHPNVDGMKLISDVFEESLLTVFTE